MLTAQPRQQTLHAVIEWSWDLLISQERTLAARISIFPARTGIAVIEAVCADETRPADEVVYLLDSLVDKSIVERAGDGYRMLETIRAHAAGKLRLAGETDTVLRGLTRYFADLADEHEPLLRSDKQAESLRLFQAEYDNLMYALQTAIDGDDAETAARMLGPLYWYWVMLRYDARAETYIAKVTEFGDALPADARAAFTAIHLVGVEGGPITDHERLRALIGDCAHGRAAPLSDAADDSAGDGGDTRAGRAARSRDRPGAQRLGPLGDRLHLHDRSHAPSRTGRPEDLRDRDDRPTTSDRMARPCPRDRQAGAPVEIAGNGIIKLGGRY